MTGGASHIQRTLPYGFWEFICSARESDVHLASQCTICVPKAYSELNKKHFSQVKAGSIDSFDELKLILSTTRKVTSIQLLFLRVFYPALRMHAGFERPESAAARRAARIGHTSLRDGCFKTDKV